MGGARGFSLLEVLVATAIFAVVAALAWGGLDAVARHRRALDDEARQWQQLQRAVSRVERELRQALPLPPVARDGQPQAAFVGRGDGVVLASAALASARVAWTCRDGGLWRRADGEEQRVLADLDGCTWAYRDATGAHTSNWTAPAPEALPRGVELRVSAARFGEIRRVVELPAAPEALR